MVKIPEKCVKLYRRNETDHHTTGWRPHANTVRQEYRRAKFTCFVESHMYV